MAERKVQTVFTVGDQATPRLKQMAKASDELAAASSKAQGSLHSVGGHAAGAHQHGIPATAAEKAQFAVDREEMLTRRKRARQVRLHMQGEQVFHRISELALMSVIGEQNKFAVHLAKAGATMQGAGAITAGLGGKVGTFGSALAKAGGYFAMAGLAVELAAGIAEHFGVDIGEAGHGIKEWAAKLVHIHTDEELAKSKGYLSEENMKAAEEMKKTWRADMVLTEMLQNHAAALPAWPVVETGRAIEDFRKATLDFTEQYAQVRGIPLGEAQKRVEEAAKNSAASAHERVMHERELSSVINSRVLPKLKAVAEGAPDEEWKRLNNSISFLTNKLVEAGTIVPGASAATEAMIRQKLEERSSAEIAVSEYKKRAKDQIELDDMVKDEIRARSKYAPAENASRARRIAFQDQLAARALETAKREHWSAERTKDYLEKVSAGIAEKQNVSITIPNARFDIKQTFAEGFDPDRIAVAFANDLAALGEHALMSPHAIVGATR